MNVQEAVQVVSEPQVKAVQVHPIVAAARQELPKHDLRTHGPSKPLEARPRAEWLPLLEPTKQDAASYPALTPAVVERYDKPYMS